MDPFRESGAKKSAGQGGRPSMRCNPNANSDARAHGRKRLRPDLRINVQDEEEAHPTSAGQRVEAQPKDLLTTWPPQKGMSHPVAAGKGGGSFRSKLRLRKIKLPPLTKIAPSGERHIVVFSASHPHGHAHASHSRKRSTGSVKGSPQTDSVASRSSPRYPFSGTSSPRYPHGGASGTSSPRYPNNGTSGSPSPRYPHSSSPGTYSRTSSPAKYSGTSSPGAGRYSGASSPRYPKEVEAKGQGQTSGQGGGRYDAHMEASILKAMHTSSAPKAVHSKTTRRKLRRKAESESDAKPESPFGNSRESLSTTHSHSANSHSTHSRSSSHSSRHHSFKRRSKSKDMIRIVPPSPCEVSVEELGDRIGGMSLELEDAHRSISIGGKTINIDTNFSRKNELNIETDDQFEESFEMMDGVLKVEGLELRRSGINVIDRIKSRHSRNRNHGGESKSQGRSRSREAPRLNPDRIVPVKKLGSGAGGSVWLAVDVGSFTLRAIKQMNVFDKSTRHQMLKEIKTFEFARTSHPNIISYHGGYYAQGEATVALEYMNCGSLRDVMNTYGPFSEAILKSMTRQVLLGLSYLHARKIIHRDIKPENILVNDRGSVKLADFGIVKELQETAAMANTYVGTAKYMSPERIMSRKYSFEADVWSLGLTISYLATGRFPFDIDESQGIFGLALVICKETPKLNSKGFTPNLGSFVSCCLEKEPDKRASSQMLLKHAFVNHVDALKLSRDWPYVYKKTSTEREIKLIRAKIKSQEELLDRVVNILLQKVGNRKLGWEMLCRSLGGQLGLPAKTVLQAIQKKIPGRRCGSSR